MPPKNRSEVGHKSTLVFDNQIPAFKSDGKNLSVRTIDVHLSREGIHAFFPFFEDSSANEKLKQSPFYKNFDKTYVRELKSGNLINYDRNVIEIEVDEVISDLTVAYNGDTKIISAIKIKTNKRNIYIGDKDNITKASKQLLLKGDHFLTGFSSYFILEKNVIYLSGIQGYFEDLNNVENYVRLPPPNFLTRVYRGVNRLISGFFRLIFLLIVLSFPLLYFYYSSQNIIKGEYLVDQVSLPVEIYTDVHGFPHIKAETKEDASFTLGFLQARDRLWQLDFLRRLSQGRLSEILGRRALKVDTTMRQLGWGLLAKRDYEFYKFHSEHESTLKQIERFAEGVNYWVKNNFLPLEYKFRLSTHFDAWTPVDSFAVFRFINMNLGQDYILELLYTEIDKRFGKEFADLVFSVRHGEFLNADTTVILDADLEKLGLSRKKPNSRGENQQNNQVSSNADAETHQEERVEHNQEPPKVQAETFRVPHDEHQFKNKEEGQEFHIPNNSDAEHTEAGHEENTITHTETSEMTLEDAGLTNDIASEGASNNWAISGKHTKSGKPIFANDPHLGNNIPNFLYPAKVYLPNNFFLVGATYPGLPFFPIGNNKWASWGVTTENSDTIDICEEKIEGDKYIYDGKQYPLEKILEEIVIQGEDPLKLVINWTRNGPLVENWIGELTLLGLDYKHFTHVSFRQNAIFFNNTSIYALERVNYEVKSVDEIRTALDSFIFPNMHFVYATVAGDISYVPVGKYPVKSNRRNGFCKGYSSEDKIDFFIPVEDIPVYTNPDKGFIVTANNKFSYSYKYELNGYHYHNRARRIDELISSALQKGQKLSVEDNIQILSDVLDVNARYLVPKLLQIFQKNGKANSKYFNILKSWDFVMDKNSVAATVYSVLELSIGENFLWEDSNRNNAVSKNLPSLVFYWDFITNLVTRIANGETIELKQCGLFAQTRDCERYFVKVFEQLEENLADFKDAEGNVKPWGEVHHQYYGHIFFDKIPFLNKLFSRSYPAGGNRNTINVARIKYSHHHGVFTSSHSACLRYICDLASPERPYLSVSVGVSGNYLSQFYDNLANLHEEAKLIQIEHHDFGLQHYSRTIYLKPTKRGSFSRSN